MGTNYYLRKHIPLPKLERIKKLVNPTDIYDGKLQEALEEFQEIHIGKSSCGWQFLFDHNNWQYYDKTKASINQFICEEILKGGQFVNEYGEEVSLKDFWELVESKKDGLTLKTSYEKELEEWKDFQVNPIKYADRPFKPYYPQPNYINYPEIITDEGLRFSDTTDFA